MGNEETRQTKEDSIDIPKLITAQDVGEMLGISSETVNELADEGRIGYVQLSASKKAFTIKLVAEFIEGETYHRCWRWDEIKDSVEAQGYIGAPRTSII